MKQLTDDDIQEIAADLHEYIQRTPLVSTEEGYDFFRDFVYSLLEDFSNGYVNYN